MTDFSSLPAYLQAALARLGIVRPTPVQAEAIAPALRGSDVLATAQTGTGKTFAFLLPLMVRLAKNPEENALILSPTRELAQQTQEEMEKLFSEDFTLQTALIIGGDNIHKQYADLRRKPRVIIATPGRLIDHIGRKSVDLKKTHFLVLDETDRMLDMGFIDDMRRIVSSLPPPRQTLLFSATLPTEIQTLANEFLNQPERVKIGSTVSPAELVLQEIVHVDIREKLPQLLHELNTRQGSILIFTRTRHGAERLAKQLKLYGQKANALHGDLRQNRRRQVLEFFRNGTVRILVATDVAARGIDVPHIAHVINYDLPQSPEDYIHRIGRTGRAGTVGAAISLISDDGAKWRDICKTARFAIPVKTVQKTIAPLPAPKFVAQEEGAAHAQNRRKVRPGKISPLSRTIAPTKPVLPQGEADSPPKKSAEDIRRKKNPSGALFPDLQAGSPSKKAFYASDGQFKKRSTPPALSQERIAGNGFPAQNAFRAIRVGASKKTLKRLPWAVKEKTKKKAGGSLFSAAKTKRNRKNRRK